MGRAPLEVNLSPPLRLKQGEPGACAHWAAWGAMDRGRVLPRPGSLRVLCPPPPLFLSWSSQVHTVTLLTLILPLTHFSECHFQPCPSPLRMLLLSTSIPTSDQWPHSGKLVLSITETSHFPPSPQLLPWSKPPPSPAYMARTAQNWSDSSSPPSESCFTLQPG